MDWKKIGKNLIFPPIWGLIMLTVISATSLVFVFTKGLSESLIAYIIYSISFYTLLVLCIYFSKVLSKRYSEIREQIYQNPLGKRYMTDAAFRTHITLYGSLAVNFALTGAGVSIIVVTMSVYMIIKSTRKIKKEVIAE